MTKTAASLAKALGVRSSSQLLCKLSKHRQHEQAFRRRVDCEKFIHLARNAPCLRKEKILLLDDVCTSGTSLEQATISLMEAQAKEVYSFALAKTLFSSKRA